MNFAVRNSIKRQQEKLDALTQMLDKIDEEGHQLPPHTVLSRDELHFASVDKAELAAIFGVEGWTRRLIGNGADYLFHVPGGVVICISIAERWEALGLNSSPVAPELLTGKPMEEAA